MLRADHLIAPHELAVEHDLGECLRSIDRLSACRTFFRLVSGPCLVTGPIDGDAEYAELQRGRQLQPLRRRALP